MAQPTIQTRLCPHCANSIATDALICPYCKADLIAAVPEPQWPEHEESRPPNAVSEKTKLTLRSKVILVLGLLVFALGVYLVGRDAKQHDIDELVARHEKILAERQKTLEERQKNLQEKDQTIEILRAEIAQVRRKAEGEIQALKLRVEEGQKNLAAAQRKLAGANQEIERLAKRPAARTADASPAQAASARPSSAIPPRTYEAVRSTSVYAAPLSSARVVSRLDKGTQITVVGSENGWLEIRSKHGNPPGFIRADDAMFISRAN